MRKADRLIRDLKNIRLIDGGRGCIIITTTGGEWIGREVSDAITGAAMELGFGETWQAVVDAIGAGCLPDLLSEAIEAAEALFADEQAEAAE